MTIVGASLLEGRHYIVRASATDTRGGRGSGRAAFKICAAVKPRGFTG